MAMSSVEGLHLEEVHHFACNQGLDGTLEMHELAHAVMTMIWVVDMVLIQLVNMMVKQDDSDAYGLVQLVIHDYSRPWQGHGLDSMFLMDPDSCHVCHHLSGLTAACEMSMRNLMSDVVAEIEAPPVVHFHRTAVIPQEQKAPLMTSVTDKQCCQSNYTFISDK